MGKKYKVSGIVWDTDGEHIENLPDSLIIICENEDQIADTLSDITGWLVSSIGSIEEIVRDKVVDMAGHELSVGDTICFTINMRKDDKPMVRATITEIVRSKEVDWAKVEYIDSHSVRWGRTENKLPSKVVTYRVCKCY